MTKPIIAQIQAAVHNAETVAERAVALIHSLIDGVQAASDAGDDDALNDILATAKATADELGAAVAQPAVAAAQPTPATDTPTAGTGDDTVAG